MRDREKRDTIRSLFLSIWAMATVVLFFCVLLLANEMVKAGQDPVDALLPAQTAPAEQPVLERPTTPLGSRDISLFFASADGTTLAPEQANVEYSDSTIENCRIALQRLIAGPSEQFVPILPAETKIRALYFLQDEGELVVDLSRELMSEFGRFKSASLESLLVYGIVNTLTQPGLQGKNEPPVRYVRLLLEGQTPQEAFPAHLDLSGPLEPDRSWISGVPEQPNA